MKKRDRIKKETGWALAVSLPILALTFISLILSLGGKPQPTGSSAASKPTNRYASAIPGKKLSEPLASEVFDLAATRAAAAEESESPDEATLTTDQEDYHPYTYVYFTGTGFGPGETVNMIVVESAPIQQTFEPWDVVADENGNIETSWYIFTDQLTGATMQASATGQSSGLSASAIFTDDCTGDSSIAFQFNNFAISAGNTIWFSAVTKLTGTVPCPVTLDFTNQTIQSPDLGTLTLPDSEIQVVSGACPASTTFIGGKWVTTVGCGFSGNAFLSGFAFVAPTNLPGSMRNITWSGTFSSCTPGLKLNWQWAASIYTSFTTDNNAIGVQPLDGPDCSPYGNSDHAGTPENFKSFLVAGGSGGGGSNFTGSLSSTAAACPFNCTPTPTPTPTATATSTPAATATSTPTPTATATYTPTPTATATATPTATATATLTPTCRPPKALPPTNVTATSFTANWSSVHGATGYELDVATDSSFVNYVPGYEELDVHNTTSYNVTGLTAHTIYYYRVRAYRGWGESPNSNVVQVRTRNH